MRLHIALLGSCIEKKKETIVALHVGHACPFVSLKGTGKERLTICDIRQILKNILVAFIDLITGL